VTKPLRIAIVGPTHPYSGGVSAHTTTLAGRLADAGHNVAVISWKAQYPRFLRGGQTRVPDGEPEVRPFTRAVYPLAWYNPLSWLHSGRRIRGADIVIVTAITPYHAVPYIAMSWAFGRRPARVVVAHNVLPHEDGAVDRTLVRALYRRFGKVLTHSAEQAALARNIAGDDVEIAAVGTVPMPDFAFGNGLTARDIEVRSAQGSAASSEVPTLLFFGIVREYKGVDLLLDAIARVPNLRLIVAGEFWQPVEEYRALVDELSLGDRVKLIDGYVKFTDLPALFAQSDALVLPYRHGTATFNVSLAHLFGLPVVSTDAGTLARDIRHDVDGLVAKADDVASLADALRKLREPGTLERLRAGVRTAPLGDEWRDYAAELVRLALSD